jgi:hypothetical protein
MKPKEKTIEIRRARQEKEWRNFYFGCYLPLEDKMINSCFLFGQNRR